MVLTNVEGLHRQMLRCAFLHKFTDLNAKRSAQLRDWPGQTDMRNSHSKEFKVHTQKKQTPKKVPQ